MFRVLPRLALKFALNFAICAASHILAADFDLIIRGARVIDGTGSPWFVADVGITKGRIAAVAKNLPGTAGRVIDAGGRALAPGFIDVHTHLERTSSRSGIEDLPDLKNFVHDGVTTVLTGNCGGSRTDLSAWFREREAAGIGPNLAALVGHGSVRRAVMGLDQRAATPDELTGMEKLVEQAMRDGAFGLSTGLIYVPGTYADTAEVTALAKVAARFGGVYSSHIRNEAAAVLEALEEAAKIGEEARLPVQISHIKVASRRKWGASKDVLALIQRLRERGVDVVVDQYPYERSSTTLDTTIPSWALAGGIEKLRERLATPADRARIEADMQERLERNGLADYSYATVASCTFDRSVEGKTITEISKSKGRESISGEIETILDLASKGSVQMIYHTMGDEDIERFMAHPNTAIASDGYPARPGEGVPHPRSYGTRARVLAHYVRDKKVLGLEEAIRRMTSLPARTFGFSDRGLVKAGFAADLVLFDPAKVQDRATFGNPHQYSEGFDLVLIDGVAVIDGGKHTGARPGKVLRKTSGAQGG